MKRVIGIALIALGLAGAAPKPAYRNDFQSAELGEVAGDILVLDGKFTVKQEGENRFLELPGTPVGGYGVVLGPDEPMPLSVVARIRGESTARRFPEFGVGLAGLSGYALKLMPAVGELQLLKDFASDTVVAKTNCAWKSGAWTMMRLRIRPLSPTKWVIEGKAWEVGTNEPAQWMLSCEQTFAKPDDAPHGRAALWGSPYSDKPIAYDDVEIGAE